MGPNGRPLPALRPRLALGEAGAPHADRVRDHHLLRRSTEAQERPVLPEAKEFPRGPSLGLRSQSTASPHSITRALARRLFMRSNAMRPSFPTSNLFRSTGEYSILAVALETSLPLGIAAMLALRLGLPGLSGAAPCQAAPPLASVAAHVRANRLGEVLRPTCRSPTRPPDRRRPRERDLRSWPP